MEHSKKVKRRAVFRVAVSCVGSCVGAGFLSGQELWQFFGSQGPRGYLSFVFSMLLWGSVAMLMISLAIDSREYRMDSIVVWFPCKPLRVAVAVFEAVFMFFVYLLNVAAFGSLVEQTFGVPLFWGGLVFCVVVTLLSVRGIGGLVRAFGVVVPLLMLVTLVVCGITIGTASSFSFPTMRPEGFVTGNWAVDGVTYAVFCLFCALPILVPLGQSMPDGKTARRGVLFGTLFLLSLIAVILLSVATAPHVAQTALPMLELARIRQTALGYVFALLLMLAIGSAALSVQSAINEYYVRAFPGKQRFLLPVTALMSAAALLLGLFGFRNLVSFLYPVLGYISTLPLLLFLSHAVVFYYKRHKGKEI